MTLVELINEKVVKVPLNATTKYDVFRELVDVLHREGDIKDKEAVLQAVVDRDDQASTALEKGIAIPHAKTEQVSRLVLAMGISPAGIDCDAYDGALSHLFFLLLAPPDQSGPHIEALCEISQATRSGAFRRLLLASQTPREVVDLFCDT